MKSNVRRIAALVLLTLAFTGLTGCGFVGALRAKMRLNDGVRTFNKGQYDKAQELFEQALEFDPDNVNAKFFYAMTVNAQFEKAVNSTSVEKAETIELGQKTMKAFEDVLAANPEFKFQDASIAFIANAHKTLKNQVYTEKDNPKEYQAERVAFLDNINKRAELPEQTPEVKAQMYYTIGDDYWRAGREAVLKYEKKDPANPMAPPTYDPIPPDQIAAITQNLDKATEFMQKAMETDPAYPEPYLGQKLVIMEREKLVTDQAQKDELKALREKWDEQHRDKLTEKQEAEARAAEAATAEAAGQE